jgi:hypothetical protein
MNNWSHIEAFLESNKEVLKEMFLFYTPLLTSKINEKEIMYEIMNKHYGELQDNTAIHNNPFDEVDINYYGGLYTLIPFFYILRFYKYEEYKNALRDMLDLLLVIFESRFLNIEQEAMYCQLFGIIADFINQVDARYITDDVADRLVSFKNCIKFNPLRVEFLQNCLLKIRIDRIGSISVIEKVHNLISSYYFGDFEWAIQVASLEKIIWYAIDNFEPEQKQDCCILHCWEQSDETLDDNKLKEIEEHYKLKCSKIKELLKFIIKELCRTRKYDLLIPQKAEPNDTPDSSEPTDQLTILEFIKFEGYSICLKKMLLECIQVGVKEDPQTLIKETELLECLYGVLEVSDLRDQITPVVGVLNECSKVFNLTKDPRNLEIYKEIGKQLDKLYQLYMRRCAQVKLRSKSEGLSFSVRKMSDEMEDNTSCDSENSRMSSWKTMERAIKGKIIKLKNDLRHKISNDKELYDLLISICCTKEPESGEVILIHDDCTKIINPYFKMCCPKFKVKLIEIIRTTVLVRSRQENLPPDMDKLSKFDHIYRFALSEFILRELDPPDQQPSEDSNYIIKNFFYIVDYMVTMKNNWDNLYLFLLRMVGILSEAKKEIHNKTQRSKQDIKMACKVCVRKFILRVIKYSEKSIENMGNMVFLVYLVVFSNDSDEQDHHIFKYFETLEKHFLIGSIAIKNQDEHQPIDKDIFID